MKNLPKIKKGSYEAVVLFLHGSMGNITVACWQVAQAANPVGLDVICPSTDWRAEWEGEEGQAQGALDCGVDSKGGEQTQ